MFAFKQTFSEDRISIHSDAKVENLSHINTVCAYGHYLR